MRSSLTGITARWGLYCALLLSLATAAVAQVSLTADQYREDLAQLARELPAHHYQPFAHMGKADFEKRVASLDAQIPKLDEAGIRTEMQRLVAALGDPRTRIVWDNRNSSGALPLMFTSFPDGIYVTGASEPYRKMLGGKVVRIGDTKVEDVIKRLTPLVATDNSQSLNAWLPDMMVTVDYLAGSGISTSIRAVPVAVEMPGGKEISDYVGAVPLYSNTSMVLPVPPETPLYRLNAGKNYWVTAAGTTIYFQCNRSVEDPVIPYSIFRDKWKPLLAQQGMERLVVDLRNDREGADGFPDPWIHEIKTSPFNRKGRLFVIVGRNTSSGGLAGAVRLADETAATLAGVTPGLNPVRSVEFYPLTLKNSQLRVLVPARLVPSSTGKSAALDPEIAVETTAQDYAAGKDPVMDAILHAPPAELLTQSEQRYRKRIETDKSDFQAYQRLYRIYASEHRDADVKRLWQGAIEANSSNADFLIQCGDMNLRDGNFPQSESAFRMVFSGNSGEASARRGLVDVLIAEGKAKEAIDLLSALIAKSPGKTDLHDELARAAVSAKQPDLAIAEYRKVAEAPDTKPAAAALAYYRIAALYFERDDLTNAVANYRKSIERVPDDALVLRALGDALDRKGERKEAVQVYLLALKQQPDDGPLLNNLAYALANSGGDLSQALAYAQRAYAMYPKSPLIADTLGWVHCKREEFGSATNILRAVVEVAPDVAEYRYHLAFALSKTGDKLEAKQQLQEALKLKLTEAERKEIDALMKELPK